MAEDRVVRIAYDVGKHAADEAMLTLMRICKSPGEEESILAAITAFAFVQYRIKVTAKAMDKVMPEFSSSLEEGAALIEKLEGPAFEEFAEAARKSRGL